VLAFLGQTIITPTGVINLATSTAGDIVDPTQVTYVVVAAVGVSFALWFVRRTLKLGR
jgi:hypothetical protein